MAEPAAFALGDFTGDPVSVLSDDIYDGYLSGVGVLMNWGSAVVCGVTAYGLTRAGDRPAASPLLYLAILLAVFALDDMYQLHEEVVQKLPTARAHASSSLRGRGSHLRVDPPGLRAKHRLAARCPRAVPARRLPRPRRRRAQVVLRRGLAEVEGIAVGSLSVARESLKRLPGPAASPAA